MNVVSSRKADMNLQHNNLVWCMLKVATTQSDIPKRPLELDDK